MQKKPKNKGKILYKIQGHWPALLSVVQPGYEVVFPTIFPFELHTVGKIYISSQAAFSSCNRHATNIRRLERKGNKEKDETTSVIISVGKTSIQ